VTAHSVSHTYYTNTDGLSLEFYLSQTPFAQNKPALIDEEFLGTALDADTWVVNDPSKAISVAGQTLRVNGGSGQDGQTTVSFIEQVELGGALELQHGDVTFAAASQGVLGGLYASGISVGGCLAGFQITPSGGGSNIQALISGVGTGPVIATQATHRYGDSPLRSDDLFVFDGGLPVAGNLSLIGASGGKWAGRGGGSCGCTVRT